MQLVERHNGYVGRVTVRYLTQGSLELFYQFIGYSCNVICNCTAKGPTTHFDVHAVTNTEVDVI